MKKRDYSDWSKTELIKEVKKLEKRKKFGIVWEPKPEKVAELCKEKLPVLEEDKKKEIKTDDKKPVNILIEGDNYHALSVLNYTHKGKVDVIYIDPPYNTGNEGFMYNDRIVDKNDGYRHSKWLSFMEKRLKLARNLMKRNGVIFISIDENEFAQIKLLCDELFGEKNYCGILVWQKKYGGGNDSGQIATEHEYIICYSKSPLNKEWLEPHTEEYLKRYKEKDEKGRFFWDTLERPGLKNPIDVIISYEGKKYNLKTFRSQKRIDEELRNGEIRIVQLKNKISFQFKQRLKEGKKPRSLLQDKKKNKKDEEGLLKIGSNASAKQELRHIFHKDLFENPKPTTLIKYLIDITGINKGIVLDFFAGSGTTGHAILDLNETNQKNIQFILSTDNQDNNRTGLKIATDICYPRINKAIKGYTGLNNVTFKGLGGNLKYFKTDFVDAKPTDQNKRKMVDKSTEMLCLKEDCFDEVKKGTDYKIFKNSQDKYLGIIFDDDGIEPFKKEVKRLNKQFVVYVFSLDESAREEEFEDMAEKVELRPIPAVILNVYKRIFK